jgi:AcrR family transcriptional regulator
MQVAMSGGTDLRPRLPLSRERVLQAAVTIADVAGPDAVTMRRLAEELGAEATSLYYHVDNKDDVLNGIADVVVMEISQAAGQVGGAATGAGWKVAVRRRIFAARQVLLRHPWAPGVFESRSGVSAAVLRYYDAMIGLMRDGGLSADLAHHALHALGSRALGFSREVFGPGDPAARDAGQDPADFAGQFPHLAGMLHEVVHDDPDTNLCWCDNQAEFEFGLDLILDGLDRLREQPRSSDPQPG